MRIIFHEMKKIWNLKIIGIIVIFSLMFYVAFLSFFVEHHPNNHHSAANLAYCVMLVEKYGNTLQPEQLEEFRQVYDELLREADIFIAANPRFAEIEVYNYADYLQKTEELYADGGEEELTDEANEILIMMSREFHDLPYINLPDDTKITASSPENNSIANNIMAADGILSRYETVLDPSVLLEHGGVPNLPGTNAVRKRHTEMVSTDEYKSVIPNETIWYTVEYAKYVALLVVIATLILLSPLLTTDRIRKVHQLQYTAHEGRRIIRKQLAAVLMSSLILTSAMILGFGAVFATNNTQFFWNSYVSSFNSFWYLSVKLTFGQYVLVMVGLLYLAGLLAALLAFILSRFCSNYIALVAGLIPSAFALGFLGNEVIFQHPLGWFFNETGIALFEPFVYLVLVAIALVAVGCILRRERRVDVG
ncbi:MAG: hypothetical protein FWG70_05515 [Oscillospiraceae bacterium]|nr:hypothetical protein [Oscillospiraceae bacterium]